jgi:tetratricopeptide (TPR) repeat protein
MLSREFKRKLIELTSLFLILYVISTVSVLDNFNFTNSDSNNINNTPFSIKTASNNPPNKDYFIYYKTITIPHENVIGSGSHKNFPVLISLLDLDLHDDVQSNGNDIAFANDTDWLDHEIELFNQSYSATHAQLIAWVRIPNLSTSVNTTIYMYYGNATMTSQENPANVWSTYNSVWHLNESNGIGYYIKDSTSNNYNGVPSGTQYLPSGNIGGARNFVDDSDVISISSGSDLLNGNNQFVISFWMYPNYTSDLEWENADEKRVFYKSSSVRMARIWRDSGQTAGQGKFQADIEFVNNGTIFYNFNIYRQTWNYIVFSYDGYFLKIYVNGQQRYSIFTDSDSLISDSSTFVLGSIGGADCFNGFIDEFRISSSVNVEEWYETEFNNQNNTESFFNLSSESIVDTLPPSYSNLIESADPLELGDTEVIQINVSDFSGISQVLIEFEGSNYSMTNIVGDSWQYNAWIPNIVGNYTYTIYLQDNMNNWNSTAGVIRVIDTTPPTCSNLIESSDPLELGQTETIQVNITDFAGISQVKIEFEGSNHSMTNIGGSIWQYNSWIPNQWIVHDYDVHMQDSNGNWNSISNNITVQDTINPAAPTLNNSPSGDVSGNLVFDWSDGNDPSGISYYILIIDNETDPSTTPGYVRFINITNVGTISSYYELTETLPSGRYHYFLAQIDGAGHQSSYTVGSFTINLVQNPNDFTIYIIIGITLASAMGSVTIIVVMRKRSQSKIGPPRKKIPFKLTLQHIGEISSSFEEEGQDLSIKKPSSEPPISEIIPEEKANQANIDEIKKLGEELFEEGAYLEAIKQFEHAKELLRTDGKEEEAVIVSELITGIKGLIKEREIRIEALDQEKIDGNSIKIFELFQEVIEISKKLKDFDAVNMFKSEMIDFYNTNKIKLIEIQRYRNNLEKQAELSSSNGQYEKATHEFEMGEHISELIMNFNKNEKINVEKFREKKLENLQKLNNV